MQTVYHEDNHLKNCETVLIKVLIVEKVFIVQDVFSNLSVLPVLSVLSTLSNEYPNKVVSKNLHEPECDEHIQIYSSHSGANVRNMGVQISG